MTRNLALYNDELDYNRIALNIIGGRGFSYNGLGLTALRPPLYPAVISLIYHLTHSVNPIFVKTFQIIASLINVFCVYLIGKEIFDKKTAILGSLFFSLYPISLGFNLFLLSECLFTLLLCLSFYFFLLFIRNGKLFFIILSGILLGLAALTRSFIWAFVIFMALFAYLVNENKGMLKKVVIPILLIIFSCLLVLAPWVVRNFNVFHSFVLIDTSQGYQFFLGNSKFTQLERNWDYTKEIADDKAAADIKFIKSHNLPVNEATKNKASFINGINFVIEHPLLTIKRDVFKVFYLWGNERVITRSLREGHFGALNTIAVFMLWCCFLFSHMFLILSGVFGIIFGYLENKIASLYLLLLVFYFNIVHAMAIGHPRFNLPLIPLIGVYSAYAILNAKNIWRLKKSNKFYLAIGVCLVFTFIWVREIAVFIGTLG